MKMGKHAGIVGMVMSILGLIIWVSVFSTIMTAWNGLYTLYGVSTTWIVFGTVLKIGPTILWLLGVVGAGVAYFAAYKNYSSSGADAQGYVRMIVGALTIVLFVTLFSTIMSNINTAYSIFGVNASTYIAYTTVVSITPAILFLGGIFGGGATAYGGYKARKGQRGAVI